MSAEARPPVSVELTWEGGQRFSGRAGDAALVLDGHGQGVPSPVQALAAALAGCMAIDVAHILTRGRWPVASLRARLTAERAGSDPRRLVRIALHFEVGGDVPGDKVQRAIELSRQTYCSVWHSLRQDLALETTFEVRPGPVAE